MRASNVGFLTIVVVGFYLICCAVAMGQTGARETPRPATAAESQAAVPQTPVERAVKTADLMAKHNGSLLRASLEAAPDASKAQVADVSFFSVPPPQPKTIKKHDLVTIDRVPGLRPALRQPRAQPRIVVRGLSRRRLR